MRILLLAEEFYPSISGGARTRWEFCTGAVAAGHNVTVFTQQDGDLPDSEMQEGVRIERPSTLRLPGITGFSTLSTISRLLLSPLFLFSVLWSVYRSDIDADIVVSTSNSMHWMAWVLNRVLDARAANFIGYSPLVHPKRHSTIRVLLAKINIRLFHAELVLCRSLAVKTFVDSATESEVQILHGIIDGELIRETASMSQADIRASLSVADDKRVIVFVGRLVPIKRPLAAVDVVADLNDVHLLMVGQGPLEDDVRDAVRERGLQDRVKLTGEVSPATALKYIARADGLLVTSEAESYCSVVLEALALDVPVFTTPVGIVTHISTDLIYTGTLDELARLIADASPDPGIHLNEEILSAYSMRRFTNDFLAALETPV